MKIKFGRFPGKELSAEEAKKWLIDSLLSHAEQLGYDGQSPTTKVAGMCAQDAHRKDRLGSSNEQTHHDGTDAWMFR